MNADKRDLINGDISERVLAAFYEVYNELGAGFLESVYESAMVHVLAGMGLEVERQASLPVYFRGHLVGDFRADLLVADRLVVEIKAVSQLVQAHEVQLVNYLKASGHPAGLLLNFGPRPQFKRRVHSNPLFNPRSSASIRVKEPNV